MQPGLPEQHTSVIHPSQSPLTTESIPASPLTPSRTDYGTMPQRTGSTQTAAMSRAELSVIVDAVSNAKEGILRDLSMLLDEKLSGLDDVVVELIRSKSENDALREEMKRIEQSRDHYQAELSKFKPAAFGFFRKES